MIREIIIPKSETHYINIPKEYVNKKIEILILPFDTYLGDTSQKTEPNIIEQTKGLLSSFKIDPIKWQKDLRNEYERFQSN